jgi:hypothetical protein
MSKFAGLVKDHKKAVIPKVQKLESTEPKMGRPRAKRSDPAYKKTSAIIKRDTHAAVQKLLIDRNQDFSELLEELLTRWVKEQG